MKDDAMKTNGQYMKSEEFKARQGSFAFFSAWAHDFVMQFHKECRSGWEKLHTALKVSKPEQLTLWFYSEYRKFWAEWTPEQNRVLFA
ncbi:MAG: hypothetical protein Q7U78_06285 [Gallionella sp.]|nr:hypothetical protein [Gallionella sp.]